jgi:hypothetical protein
MPDAEPQVVLLLVSSEATESATVNLLAERLNELHVETLTESTEPKPDSAMNALARSSAQRTHAALVVWFQVRSAPHELHIYDSQSEQLSSRRLPEADQSAAAREERVIIATSTINALLESQREGASPRDAASNGKSDDTASSQVKPAPTPANATTRPAPVPRTVEATHDSERSLPAAPDSNVELLLGYLGTSSLAAGGSWQNGANASLLLWLPKPLHVSASYALLPAQRVAVGENEIELARHPINVAVGLNSRAPWRHWQWLMADLTASVDRVTRTTRSPEAVLVATQPAARWLWDVGVRAGAAVSLVSNLSLYGLVGGKLGASRFDYVAAGEQSEERTHFGQASAQLELGLCVSVF